MPRQAEIPVCTESEFHQLTRWSKSKTIEQRMSERSKIILMSAAGQQDAVISQKLHLQPNVISLWRKRFIKERLEGLFDRKRSGKPPKYDPIDTRNKILALLETDPPKGQSTWDGKAVAKELGISSDKVWEILRNNGISLQRQRSWSVSTDSNFVQKVVDITGFYLDPPTKAVIVSIDEKPSNQAIKRCSGYVKTSSGMIVRGLKSSYKRNGHLNLFAALDIATGVIKSSITEKKYRVDFLGFMDEVISDLDEATQEVHVILDNYCTHKKCDEWLSKHSNVTFHYMPTSASWLDMVEIWFGLFSRKALKGASFKGCDELSRAITDFVEVYNKNAEPFVWRKREAKGMQLKNTIRNLQN